MIDLAVDERSRDVVGKAELAFEALADLGAQQRARARDVGADMLDPLDILGLELVLLGERQQVRQRLVIAAAARPWLDARALVLEVVDLAEKLRHGWNVALRAAEIVGVPLPPFDDVRIRRVALGRQLGGDDAVPRRLSGMERLGHGAEVAAEPSGLRAGDAQGHASLLGVQSEQLRGCSRRCHRSVDCGGVPITVRMVVGGEPRADFVTHDPRREHIAAGQVQFVSRAQAPWA